MPPQSDSELEASNVQEPPPQEREDSEDEDYRPEPDDTQDVEPMEIDDDNASEASVAYITHSPPRDHIIQIVVPTLEELGLSADDYEKFDRIREESAQVAWVLNEFRKNGKLHYKVQLGNGETTEVDFMGLVSLKNGDKALHRFLNPQNNRSEDRSGSSEDDQDVGGQRSGYASGSTRQNRRRNLDRLRKRRASGQRATETDVSEDASAVQRPTLRVSTRSRGLKQATMLAYDNNDSDDDLVINPSNKRPKRRTSTRSARNGRGSQRRRYESDEYESEDDENRRRSGRSKRQKQSYAELDMDEELVRLDVPSTKVKPRVLHSKEIFPVLDNDDEFVVVHNQRCEACKGQGHSSDKGRLICCQGCSVAYHKYCIGHRAGRDHLVTKIDDTNFVLQCRRCVGRAKRKDPSAAASDKCVDCNSQGRSCEPFKPLKLKPNPILPDGSRALTPETDVPGHLLYNAKNVLFRCIGCYRAWHFNHLPSRTNKKDETGNIWQKRVDEYTNDFKCTLCLNLSGKSKIANIVAWRPSDPSAQEQDPKNPIPVSLDDFDDDEREYLVRFVDESYFRCRWLPGAWIAGQFPNMRSAYVKKRPHAVMATEQAIEEEWLRVDIVLEVEYTSHVPVGNDVEVDLARIREVSRAYVKYRGLTYDDVVWEEPPKESETERWQFWKTAYEDWVHGLYVHLPKTATKKVEKARTISFDRHEMKEQPDYISGGTLMDYQKEGMNWLYYKWWQGQNAVLADEMGLGKTIQIIAYLSVLFEQQKIWPFLIVVPHSTVPNWKREIQLWAPSLRVVAYYGSEQARKLTRRHEMFHPNGTDLKCHIVVTSYTCPATPSDASMLRKISWESLVVDEGQRLKNDDSLLYKELGKFRIRHKVLLSGTPLQNNPRELFNLLQFLDPKVNAKDMDEEYSELTNENVAELHNIIRPFFLRRTKTQVLKNLPPMAEVIVPVTMSTLQRKLYKSILAKDTNLIKSILYRGDKLKSTEKTKLNNLLMQLRKCVCHPFLYNQDIEEKVDDPALLHQNLVEAGSKLKLLSILLPKLKEKGHRVLLFSQFLGMLDIVEDFLDGMGLLYQRLDGSVPTLEKQKRIDAYNKPGSDFFAFLLSTRAGGVGINLATADTVIIMDPDFNPHQDIQALSRAHRIGQKNKVLVFHLVTRDTAEERILQIGKKKLSMDHLIIEKMATKEEEEELDVESILRFGAMKLFNDDAEEKNIIYDDESIEKLLDRTSIESTSQGAGDGAAENAFSFARVWANDKGSLEENPLGVENSDDDRTPEPGFWEKVLKQREEEAKKEEAAHQEELGRGRRRRTVNYAMEEDHVAAKESGDSDTDFRADKADEASESESEQEPDIYNEMQALQERLDQRVRGLALRSEKPNTPILVPNYDSKHNTLDIRKPPMPPIPSQANPGDHSMPLGVIPPKQILPEVLPIKPKRKHSKIYHDNWQRVEIIPLQDKDVDCNPKCKSCMHHHPPGSCPLKKMGTEKCPFCDISHFGKATSCPHFTSETQMVLMLDSLSKSNEDPELVEEAKRYIRRRKVAIQKAKRDKQKLEARTTAGLGQSPSLG